MTMERCESAPAGPVLNDSDYFLPCNGIGETGHAKKTPLGKWSTDTGQFSSRINQIIKQAGKFPGPGKYVGHTEWTGNFGSHGGNKFQNGSREYKDLAKGPDPRHYERKDFGSAVSSDPANIPMIVSNASKDCVSSNPRILHGRVPKGKLRSFLDQAERHGKASPAPGHYYGKDMTKCERLTNKLDNKPVKICEWQKEMVKSVSRGKKVEDGVAPGHYTPNWNQIEDKGINYTVPKAKASNFLDKAVREKMVSIRPKELPIPGPGQYDLQNWAGLGTSTKVTRGTFHGQLRGLGRNTASGYL